MNVFQSFKRSFNPFSRRGSSHTKRRPLRLEGLESRVCMSVGVVGGTLYIQGDDPSCPGTGANHNDDVVTIDQSHGLITAALNGLHYTQPAGTPINGIDIRTVQGHNTVNVLRTSVPVAIAGGDSGGADTINLGSNGRVQGIGAHVSISDYGARILVDDSADTAFQTVTLAKVIDPDGAAYGTIAGLSTGSIDYLYSHTSAVTIKSGNSGDNAFIVQNTGTYTNLICAGHTGVTIVDPSGYLHGNHGSVPGLQGTLDIENSSAANSILVDDHGDGSTRMIVMGTFAGNGGAPWGFIKGLAPGEIHYKYAGTKDLALEAGNAPGNTLAVHETGVSTHLYLNNASHVLVGNAGKMQGIGGTLDIERGNSAAAPSDIVVDDSTDGTARSVVLTNFDSGGNPWGLIHGIAPADVRYDAGIASSVMVNGGSGGNSFLVAGVPSVTTALVGGTGVNTLIGPNASNGWNVSGVNSGVLDGKVLFTAMRNLVGGNGVDAFVVAAAGKVSSIDGGGAPANQGDWLDYSSLATPVAVNLATGSATNVNGGAAGAVKHVQNVRGGSGSNTLTGSAQGNILVGGAGVDTLLGGTGSNLLIGGKGADRINSMSGRSILIGGSTVFDANNAALMSIMAEWQSSNSYAARIAHLKYGGGLNGGNRLTLGVTVLDDGAANVLTGAPPSVAAATDWFFRGAHDAIQNYLPGEQIN